MFGSANFDNRSLELNDELNVAVGRRDLAARFIADFEQRPGSVAGGSSWSDVAPTPDDAEVARAFLELFRRGVLIDSAIVR